MIRDIDDRCIGIGDVQIPGTVATTKCDMLIATCNLSCQIKKTDQ